MSTLAGLPRDIIALFLHGPHRSFLAIKLWKCGDSLLQEKLAQSVTSIDLKDEDEVPSSRWPSCLSRFRKLRQLSVCLPYGKLASSSSELQRWLLDLPPGLEELRVISRDRVLENGDDLEVSEFEDSFRSLLKLELPQHGASYLTEDEPFYIHLTRNIRELILFPFPRDCLLDSDSRQREWSSDIAWPPYLEKLSELPVAYSGDLDDAPSGLQSIGRLTLELDPLEVLRFMPTELVLENDAPWSLELSESLPSSVTSLSISSIGDVGDHHWAELLPRNLKSLHLRTQDFALFSPEIVAHLPKSLTEIAGLWRYDSSHPAGSILDLPNLKILDIFGEMAEDFIDKLPPSLTHYSHVGAISPRFPPNITLGRFESHPHIVGPIEAPQLKTLDVELPSELFQYLPPSLTKLIINNGVYDEPFTFNLSFLTTLQIEALGGYSFKLLPRTLTSLTFHAHNADLLYTSQFEELPRGLRSLFIQAGWTNYQRILSSNFASLVELELLITGFVVDIGICQVVASHLPKLRFLAINEDRGGRDQYCRNMPARFSSVSDYANIGPCFAVVPKPRH